MINYVKKIKIPTGLSFFEKTMLVYAYRSYERTIFCTSDVTWRNLCDFYGLDFDTLFKYYNHDQIELEEFEIYEEPKCEDEPNKEFFIDDLYRVYLICNSFSKIRKTENFYGVLNLYNDISCQINVLNSDICVREAMNKGYLSIKFRPYDGEEIANIYTSKELFYLLNYQYDEDDKAEMIKLFHKYYYHKITEYLETVFLILALQFVKYSPFSNTEDKNLTNELMIVLLKILKNAKIISIYKNFNFLMGRN